MNHSILQNYDFPGEPLSRFYPSQEADTSDRLPTVTLSKNARREQSSYFRGRHPVLVRRLYEAIQLLMDSYDRKSFLYDDYPDYLSLRLMRDRLLRENPDLTKDFLQEGCPILWLELLTDTIISEQLSHNSYR